ncbi:Uncharacterized protein FWK35_00021842 [Aphis craccivora]|uniref:Uncharacterized protein n=1 Tax=Aphis craccivora TaxID=307492 RepID=A0A6G0YAW1_APHCR|nr:Uncharacterized protein FWK35_00021842 [Aphis craccivora]
MSVYSITSRNNALISNFVGGFRWQNQYPWCIIEFSKKSRKTKKKKNDGKRDVFRKTSFRPNRSFYIVVIQKRQKLITVFQFILQLHLEDYYLFCKSNSNLLVVFITNIYKNTSLYLFFNNFSKKLLGMLHLYFKFILIEISSNVSSDV